MKGLNIKRIAALGLGAALVGSALAPAVMAAAFSNMDQLTKTNIVDSTGTPVVDIIVGSMGQAPDVVWAGNIAAAVAQLATTDVAGSGAKTVDFTVGGTSTTTGEGRTTEVEVNLGVNSDFTGMTVNSTKMPSLVNDNSVDWEVDGDSVQVDIEETLAATGIDAYAQTDNGSSAYAFNEMVASVPAGAIDYTVTLGTAMPEGTELDSNANYDIKVPFLGKNYVVDEFSTTGSDRVVMYSDTLPTELATGELLEVTPTTAYAGKKVEVKLVDLFESSVSSGTYEAKWAVLVDGVVQDYYSAVPSYDLKDVFDDSYFTDTITVSDAGRNSAAGTYTATIRTGADRIELVNGEGYPFTDDSDVDDAAQWEAVVTPTTIGLTNQWAYTKDSGSEGETSKHVLKVGEEIVLPNDFAKFTFVGFQEKARRTATLGTDAMSFSDVGGNEVEVPYYVMFDLDDTNVGTVELNGKDFTFAASDNETFYWEEGAIDTEDPTSLASGALDYNSAVANVAAGAGVDDAELDLGLEDAVGNSVDVNYYFTRVDDKAAIVLAAQSFDLYSDDGTPTLEFIDTNNDNGAGVAYYLPNANDFEEVVSGYTNDDDIYMAAKFKYTDIATGTGETTMFMKTGETAEVWGAEDLENMSNISMYGPGYDADFEGTLFLSENEDDLKTIATNDGSTISVDGDTFVISVPEEKALVEAYLGSTDTTTSTTGGTTYTGVTAGQTKGNVTVTNITGATAGKAIVKVGNIVKLDTDSAYGKSIIVGGFMVNKAAANLQVDGKTLQERLVASGDYVSAVLADGKIVVAGWTAGDTATAAQVLIAALDKF